MAQVDAVDRQFVIHRAAPVRHQAGIMVANDPMPAKGGSQLAQKRRCVGLEPRLAAGIVKIIAQAENRFDLIMAGKPGQFIQRRTAIIRRQELPVHRIARRLFKVQVGDQQRPVCGPVERGFSRCLKAVFAKYDMRAHTCRYGQGSAG